MELVVLEYRQVDFQTPRALGRRVANIADACGRRGLGAMGLGRLLLGSAAPLNSATRPAVIFGLRAQTNEGVLVFAEALSVRGYSGIYSWVSEGEKMPALPASVWAGLGVVEGKGGDSCMVGASLEQIEAYFEEQRDFEDQKEEPSIWMPAPDRFERAVDGLFLEQARRRGADLVWVPGVGINIVDREKSAAGMQIITARLDRVEIPADSIARWAEGDRVERGRARVREMSEVPKRWLRHMTGH